MFNRKPKRVYVLGAGPAGLLAAHAATTKGYDVTVFSAPGPDGKVRKSDLFGCQYLHETIPGITYSINGRPVRYMVDGTTVGYRAKVYGENYEGTTSADEFGPAADHYAWDLREAYDELWLRYGVAAVSMELNPTRARVLFDDPHSYVVTSLPAPALCRDMENHRFASQQVWAMGSRDPQEAQHRMPYLAPDMTVVCNGWRDTAWYRAATVFGYSTLEWPGGTKPPIRGVAAVSKPLSTDCRCWLGERGPRRTLRVGRYGTWTKGVLVHTAYFETLKALP